MKSDEESATICVATEPDVVTNTHYIIPVNHGATHRVPKYDGSTDRPWRMFGLSFSPHGNGVRDVESAPEQGGEKKC